jgi:polysaccharide biosynthesis transport protein
MELRAYWRLLWRRRFIILFTTIIATTIAWLGSLALQPVYKASVKLQVATPARGALNEVQYDLDYADRLMNTYIHIAESGPVLRELAERYGLPEPPEVEAEILANTELLKLTVEAADPLLASQLANTLADLLVVRGDEWVQAESESRSQTLASQLGQLEEELGTAQQNYNRLAAQPSADAEALAALEQEITAQRDLYATLLERHRDLRAREVIQASLLAVIDPATPPEDPARPILPLNLALGLLVGALGGLGLALLFENLDTTLHSVDKIEAITQLDTLATIPLTRQAQWPAVIMNSHAAPEEAFARLAVTVAPPLVNATGQLLLVTSAQPGEGKSTVGANLATALAKTGRQVLVVDCNFYHPSQHEIFHLPNEVGLADVLQYQMEAAKVVQPTIRPHLRVLPTGEYTAHPSELWTAARLARLVQQLRTQAEIILLDAPAFLAASDTLTLAAVADQILLVVGQSLAHEASVKLARQALGQSAKIAGVVVNRVTQSNPYHYGWN